MAHTRTRKVRRGFTLVELLVVVLILAILMAVALPLYLGAIASSEKATARANMQTIANANQSFKLQTGAFATNIAQLYSPNSDLGPNPLTGPGTRTYDLLTTGACDHDGNPDTPDQNIPAGSFAVRSSIATDGCFIPGLSNR
ncbi:MAG: prepilin-type N-terminal cleavage/methylation domain-containing protein [Chloroherpetonaceae bacterium]|nr:prepilin-type N-terminal cleavage/methylation domain-containing protein [Chthonomonadaceae bacterium]MDW8206882.1 prepilin-type N-terminal cleavage/methylation domain-containing protein [Chloroherpetonaceae bacterium]